MLITRLIWLLTAILYYSAPIYAEPLGLQQAEEIALKHNAALQMTQQRATALATIPAQAGSLPDPVLTWNASNLPVDSFSTTQENMTQMQIGVSQSIPFPGKRDLRREVASKQAMASAYDAKEAALLLRRNVRVYWWNIAYLDKALQLVQNNTALLRNLVQVSESKYKTGKGLQQDVLLAQLELSRLLEQAIDLRMQRASQVARLNALLGRDASIPVTLPASLPALMSKEPDVAQLKAWAEHHRPGLQALAEQTQAADARTALAEHDMYPDIQLGAAYGFRQGINPANNQPRSDLASMSVSLNIPLYAGSKQKRAIDQRKAEHAEAQYAWLDVLHQVHADIEVAASDFKRIREKLALYQQGIIPQARQTSASMLAGYQVNKVDFLNLVRAQVSAFNHDVQYWLLYAMAAQAEARLAAAAGKTDLHDVRSEGENDA